VRERAASLRAGLAEVDGVAVHDQGEVKGGIVTFTVAGRAAEAVKAALREQAINVWVSTAGGARWDMDARGLSALVRASVHYLTTDEEIARLAEAVADLSGTQEWRARTAASSPAAIPDYSRGCHRDRRAGAVRA
jgi:selenocysteine lyase/cysteine desulfurase